MTVMTVTLAVFLVATWIAGAFYIYRYRSRQVKFGSVEWQLKYYKQALLIKDERIHELQLELQAAYQAIDSQRRQLLQITQIVHDQVDDEEFGLLFGRTFEAPDTELSQHLN